MVRVQGRKGPEGGNQNQAQTRKLQLQEIRQRHADQLHKAAEDKPFGRADRHVAAAWLEMEAEDK
jgi:hypothetical protein